MGQTVRFWLADSALAQSCICFHGLGLPGSTVMEQGDRRNGDGAKGLAVFAECISLPPWFILYKKAVGWSSG
jgi:hypothetical protein